MLDDFQNILNVSITIGEVLQNLVVAFICGLLISFFYRITYRGPGYSFSFINSLIILSMITSLVIMVIGNNLARAFGLVGAMSIIRFRTAIKETQDIIFIFFSLAIGMAAGVGLHALAFTGTIAVGGILYILNKSNAASPAKKDFLLQFSYSVNGGSDEAEFLPVFEKFCKSTKLINTKTMGSGDLLELSYHVKLKDVKRTTEFIKELKNVNGVNHVNLFFDEEYF
ncbi:MAG: DUF4956 domain-containing protein [Ignavibacteriales bacterium]|nr:MAG: DUF4956 domain-containing protein [Ignavibacteriales bacterium]